MKGCNIRSDSMFEALFSSGMGFWDPCLEPIGHVIGVDPGQMHWHTSTSFCFLVHQKFKINYLAVAAAFLVIW